jgi:hypothetical protein
VVGVTTNLPYVMAVSTQEPIWTNFNLHKVKELVATLTEAAWVRNSCGEGSRMTT